MSFAFCRLDLAWYWVETQVSLIIDLSILPLAMDKERRRRKTRNLEMYDRKQNWSVPIISVYIITVHSSEVFESCLVFLFAIIIRSESTSWWVRLVTKRLYIPRDIFSFSWRNVLSRPFGPGHGWVCHYIVSILKFATFHLSSSLSLQYGFLVTYSVWSWNARDVSFPWSWHYFVICSRAWRKRIDICSWKRLFVAEMD